MSDTKVPTLESARMPSLRDKQLAEAEKVAEVLESVETKKKVKKLKGKGKK